jgi:FKBP-type peptidyl-prolyl cis-trans isomerase FklB
MKSVCTVAVAVLTAGIALAAEAENPLKTDKDKVSYSIGLDIGQSLRQRTIDVDPDVLARGIKDALGGGKTLLTEEQARAALETFGKEVAAKEESLRSGMAEKNKREGEAFLAENKKKDGVKTLPSGLQYKVVKAGTGKKPKASEVVKTHYRGTLTDGTEFDSSYRRNEPAVFPVTGVIPGWTEALQLMPVGSKWQLVVPSPLAYGERGAGAAIGPNAVLIFEVELLNIEEAPPGSQRN